MKSQVDFSKPIYVINLSSNGYGNGSNYADFKIDVFNETDLYLSYKTQSEQFSKFLSIKNDSFDLIKIDYLHNSFK